MVAAIKTGSSLHRIFHYNEQKVKIGVAVCIMAANYNFDSLVESIQITHQLLQQDEVRAINRNLTVHIWLMGFYIVTFEQGGEDRAGYGEQLLQRLAERLNTDGFSYRNLKLYRQFYQAYPQIAVIASQVIEAIPQIGQTVSAQLQLPGTPDLAGVPVGQILAKLSFSHLTELLPIEDPLKRAFYEIECIKGNWSVWELRRQISTLYFERMGLSKDLRKLSDYVQSKVVELTPRDVMQSPFTFEFLGLKAKDVLSEDGLETALLEHLQEFMLELGNGFCLEARQKRLLIGDEYFFVDLVFYHRLLRCHVLVELKVDEFKHEHIGQLNSYLGYYRAEVIPPTDNPPVSILLVTNQNQTLVEYATPGLTSACSCRSTWWNCQARKGWRISSNRSCEMQARRKRFGGFNKQFVLVPNLSLIGLTQKSF